MSEEYLDQKFLEHVGALIGEERAEKALKAFKNIANATDVGQIPRAFAE